MKTTAVPMHCPVCRDLMAWHRTLAVVHCVNVTCREFDRHYIVAAAKKPTPIPDDFKPAA